MAFTPKERKGFPPGVLNQAFPWSHSTVKKDAAWSEVKAKKKKDALRSVLKKDLEKKDGGL